MGFEDSIGRSAHPPVSPGEGNNQGNPLSPVTPGTQSITMSVDSPSFADLIRQLLRLSGDDLSVLNLYGINNIDDLMPLEPEDFQELGLAPFSIKKLKLLAQYYEVTNLVPPVTATLS